jgi:mRNA-degrading endonuclease toxin of MazEF toxin-antitoxin module
VILASANDKIQVITASTGAIKVHASWKDYVQGVINPGRANTAAITTATTTDVATVSRGIRREVEMLSVRNTHASTSNAITVQHTDGTTAEEIWKGTLLAGESVVIDERGVCTLYDVNGSVKAPTAKLDVWLRVTDDVVNATTSFADITGLTTPLLSGRKYAFEANLFHANDATTTGSQFGYNIGAAPTVSLVGTIDTVTPSVTAAAVSAGTVTARDTAVTAQTTGDTAVRLAVIKGYIQPSADGTFAMRCKSEVAVAAGLTVKAGSWLHIRELDN